MEIQIKGVKQLRAKIEKRTGEMITAAIWNQDVVLNKTLIGESGPEHIVPYPPAIPAPARGTDDVILECEYCAQLNLLVPERAHKGCGACGGMLNLDLVVEENDQADDGWLIGVSGASEIGVNTVVGGTPLSAYARAVRDLQVAIGSSLLPTVKAATDACNKLGRAVAGNQTYA
ncbi:MAG: hypothetical protein KAJ01_10390 [Candidatus Hydrogenedentes bacterium]|nr:hypothetical protein [Candidatus Hydrogenedentota bacterium]